ncbi:MAG: hypothetical protein RIQ43_1508, partial [Pseudomonadota bacterium]
MTAFRFHLGFALAVALSMPAAALEQTVQGVSRSDNSLTLSTDKGTVRVRFLNAESVEVFYKPTGLAQLDSFALIGGGFTGATTLRERGGIIDFGTTELKVRIDKAPLRIRFEKDGKTLLSENGGLQMTGTTRGFNFALQAQEKLMGTGQRVLGMDRRGHKLPLYNKASYGYTTKAEQMYYSLPAVVSSNKYLLLFDPLDGSSNIDVNVSIGTIFSVLKKPESSDSVTEADFLQPGNSQVAAGYCVYGPQTTLVLTVGDGVAMFTLDREQGSFVLTQENVRIPEDTREFAINMSNMRHWDTPVSDYIAECLAGSTGPRGKDFNMRWVASMVADVHRILTRG